MIRQVRTTLPPRYSSVLTNSARDALTILGLASFQSAEIMWRVSAHSRIAMFGNCLSCLELVSSTLLSSSTHGHTVGSVVLIEFYVVLIFVIWIVHFYFLHPCLSC